MSESRLRRLLASELEDCCAADVERRRETLESLRAGVPDHYQDDLAAMRALSTDTRYLLVRLLVAADDELCVCELTPLVDVSDSAVSHALSDLTEAGLVTRRKEGTWRYYDATERAHRIVNALDGDGSDAGGQGEVTDA